MITGWVGLTLLTLAILCLAFAIATFDTIGEKFIPWIVIFWGLGLVFTGAWVLKEWLG